MDAKELSAPKIVATPAEVSTRLSELFLKTAISQSIIISALEIPKSFDVVQQRSFESHRSGESGVLDILIGRKIINGISSKDQFDPLLKAFALQTTMNAEVAISAAAIILSHSTADDAFTAACEMAIDLEPEEWISKLNLKKSVTLQALKEKGADRVFADELRSYRNGLGGKSMVKRADLLFGHVPIKLHGDIA
jgi:hypothetical protein